MKRGRKPVDKMRPRGPLTETPPAWLDVEQKKIYVDLAKQLIAEGYACLVDSKVVAMAASAQAFLLRLEKEVAKLKSLIGEDGKVSPLVREMRSTRAQLQSLYGALLMTPRSRSSSRLAKETLRPGLEGDELGDFLRGGVSP